MLVSPYKHIRKPTYLVWDLTGTIDALPIKLKKLDIKSKMHWVWRSKDIFTEGLCLTNHQKKKLRRIGESARKAFERQDDVNPLHFITYMGSTAIREKVLDFKERNRRLKKLFCEIAVSLGFIEEGYNENVVDFIISTRDFFVHYLVTNLPKEPALVVISNMNLLHAFKKTFFYVRKSREEFLLLLKNNIIKNRNKDLFLVIGDEYFKEIKIAHEANIPSAWINTGRIKEDHYFHPELVANSPDELVSYLYNL